ncbi:hypothetical protein NEOLEDRAFT_1140732 [Neolentinus lepideus HHB14362 ss-1]|uniref:Secreted protein n=1 Tax=Neolentinus lepideus HHB14362 ss-1 TaxID=1314782 RepID=A0A165P2V6_9AGAM|nr:hypothetical protein NEOLEDRAFT_1140732 [Neolentinus lepideus HHB14362 ss-1]
MVCVKLAFLPGEIALFSLTVTLHTGEGKVSPSGARPRCYVPGCVRLYRLSVVTLTTWPLKKKKDDRIPWREREFT